MSDTWVAAPRKAPYRCRRTGQDSPDVGPYFEESLGYCEAPGDDRELTLYHSPAWIKSICDASGSPFILLDRDAHADMTAELETLRLQLADAEATLAERGEEITTLRAANAAIDVQALANGLVVRLEDHFAKKTGRKPAA